MQLPVFLTLALLLAGCATCARITSQDNVTSQESMTSQDNQTYPERKHPYDVINDAGLWPVYYMANGFVDDMVQLKYLWDLQDSLRDPIEKPEDIGPSWENETDKWTLYFAGYIACLCAGAVMVIAMPIIGISVACCRCCGNCGGSSGGKESKSDPCARACCGAFLLFFTLVVILGLIPLYALNDKIRYHFTSQNSVFDDVNDAIRDVITYADGVVVEADTELVDGFTNTSSDILRKLYDIADDSLWALDEVTRVMKAYEELSDFTHSLPEMNATLLHANGTLRTIDTLTTELDSDLSTITDNILQGITSCTNNDCDNVRYLIGNLTFDANFTVIDLQDTILAIQQSLDDDIIADVDLIGTELNKIVTEVNNTIYPLIDDFKAAVIEIEADITKYVQDINETLIIDVKADLNEAIDVLDDAKDEAEFPVNVYYGCMLTLCILFTFVPFCFLMGLAYGACAPRPEPSRSACCACDRATGADFLLAGVGITFVMYWLLMLIVMALFAGGGVAHTEVCTHVVNYQNENSARVLDMFDELIQLNDTKPFDIYAQCQYDASIYSVFDLENNGYNITGIIDLTEIQTALDGIKAEDINIPPIVLMTPDLNLKLTTLETALNELDFEAYFSELDKDILNIDLSELTDALEQVGGFEQEIEQLNNLTISHVNPARNLSAHVEADLLSVYNIVANISLTDLVNTLLTAQDVINFNGSNIISIFINKTADGAYNDTLTYKISMETYVRNSLGGCRPLYDAGTDGADASCIKTLYPINGVWFCLGWILFFLIPCIILAFNLADMYRKDLAYNTTVDRPIYNAYTEHDGWSYSPEAALITPVDSKRMYVDGMQEYENPVFVTEELPTNFHIPRPQVTYNYSNQIPRPQVTYEVHEEKVYEGSPPPSYRTMEGKEADKKRSTTISTA